MFRHRPAMKFAVPLSLGILIGWEWTIPIWLPLLFLLALSALAARCGALLPFRGALICLAVVAAGVMKITADGKEADLESVGRAAGGGFPVLVSGRLEEPPRFAPRSIRLLVEAESVAAAGSTRSVTGRVLVSVRRGAGYDSVLERSSYGTAVSVRARLSAPGPPGNPGEFDRRAYLRLNDITAEMFVDRTDSLAARELSGASILERWVFPARRSVGEVIEEYFRGEEAEFLKGLLIGERGEIPFEVKRDFIDSGVMHILAVSGLHVVIVSMMLLVMLEALRVPEKFRLVLMAVLLAYYTFFTGATASVARSVLMALVLLFSRWAERRADVYNALALSALVILFVDARQLFQPGFQLSYVAVFSLVYLYPKIMLLKKFVPPPLKSRRLLEAVGTGLAVSAAAGVGTIPFGAYYFGKISLVGFGANLLVVPLSNLILCLGMLTVALAYFSAWLAGVYAAATSVATWLLLESVHWFARLPFASVGGRFGAQFFILSYGAIAFALNIVEKTRRARGLLLALASGNLLIWGACLGPAREGLRVTVLDVGQGDAILLEFPGGHAVLVDGGPKSFSFDAGERVVLPYLRWRGIDRLDAVVVTHPHSDHLGGVPAVLRQMEVSLVADAGMSVPGSIYREYARLADSLKIPRRTLRAGETLEAAPSARCYVLAPGPEGAPGDSRANRGDSLTNHGVNNRSVVLKVVYGATSILLSGDAEREVEESMAARFGSFLASGVLKAGHHGSKTSSALAYLDQVSPARAVISVGARNTFGHPSPELLARLRARGTGTLRTDEQGAVVLESDASVWSELEWRLE